jgi:hypothetical protein
MAKAGITGGSNLESALKKIAEKLGNNPKLRVGFFEDKTYPDGTPVAAVAVANEFGATIKVPEHETTVFRQVNKAGTGFNKNGRFVKEAQANFATTHVVPAHTITVPPRPFFRTMVKTESGHWGSDLAKVLKETDYDAERALGLLGEQISGELVQQITDFSDPPNAPSTIAKKGLDQPLIDTGEMRNSIGFEVEE